MKVQLLLTYLTNSPEDQVTVQVESIANAEELLSAIGWDEIVEATVCEDLSAYVTDGNPYREIAVLDRRLGFDKLTLVSEVVEQD